VGVKEVCAKRNAAAEDPTLKLLTLAGGGCGGGGRTVVHWHE